MALEVIIILLTHEATRQWLQHEYQLVLNMQQSSVFTTVQVIEEMKERTDRLCGPISLPRANKDDARIQAPLQGGGYACGCKTADNDIDINLYGISRACPALPWGHDRCSLCAGGKAL